MKEPVINPEIFMDESEFADTLNELTVDELRACQSSMTGKYHDFFLKPRIDDE